MRGTSVVAGLTILLFFESDAFYGQVPPKLEFEVASIRASAARVPGQRPAPATRSGGPGTADPGRVSYSNRPLSDILADAFDVYWNQITGPDWVAVDRYEIMANVPAGTTKEQAKRMLQNLLVDRFHLVFHMQTKLVEGYELTLAPGGPKLNVHSDASPAPETNVAEKDPFPTLAAGEHIAGRMQSGRTYMRFADTSVPEFIRSLSGRLSPAESFVPVSQGELRGAPAPILDKTGLTGTYDFDFDYAGGPFFTNEALPRILGSMKSSLTKELGLKMVEAKVQVMVLVIDRMERTPTEN